MDRYQSLLNSSTVQLSPAAGPVLSEIPSLSPLKAEVNNYRLARTAEQERGYVAKFKQHQSQYHGKLKQLSTRLPTVNPAEQDSARRQLADALRQEMNLELEFEQLVQLRTKQKQLNKINHAVAYALRDLEEKYQELKYLEKCIEECVSLLSVVGILVHEQGQKLDIVTEELKGAVVLIQKTEVNVKKAVESMKRRKKRMCILILVAIVLIVAVLVVLFAIKIIPS